MKTLQMQSCVHPEGTIECAFFEVDIPDPKEHEVLIQVEAAPINPSDLGLMFGPAAIDSAKPGERNGYPSVTLSLPPAALKAMSSRVGQWMPAGNEAAGTVIAAGNAESAQAMMGQRVGAFGGEMYAGHRCLPASTCMVLPDPITAEQGASCFVNPMTALGFVETLAMEGHKAIVHTAAASNLGQMLNRICLADDIPLVSIVRSSAQRELLESQGAKLVVDSSTDNFNERLFSAVAETEATLAFDAIGGGKLANQILMAMEAAAVGRAGGFTRYGSEEMKQVYIYGALDMSPTTLSRGYGFCWGVSGWLLVPFLQRFGGERVEAMKQRVVSEMTTTFASHYSSRVRLTDALAIDAIQQYGVRATGQKTLIVNG
ncbi:NADH oxidoreductase [Luminiphilus syltensis NOR5-1B]|uniref:NADH oxidoreductase n=1 Tax=Luminiphilus syltensis NOR5-1B TaxID=565045 RepID=B8KYB6_9GAMM|nr:zinc-binding dehydrogenase [Luminiphilus syltensis]EED34102.1 NADH oxidoreductase [Luminiphilus syltensis NOR5-1B]